MALMVWKKSTSPSTLTLSTSHIAAMNTPVRDMPSLRMLHIHQNQPIDHLIIITLNDWTIDFQVIQWTVLSNAWPRPWQQLLMKNVFHTRTQFPEWISFLFHSFSIGSITYSSIYAKHCLVHSRILHTSFILSTWVGSVYFLIHSILL